MNILDRAIAAISPERALRRAQARMAIQVMAGSVRRTGAGRSGTLGNWQVQRLTRHTEAAERQTLVDRAADLAANNPHAASIIDSSSLSTVGASGLQPQSKPPANLLGITEEQAAAVADQAEWVFWEWSKEADADGLDHFADLQYQSIRNVLVAGEYLNLPVWIDRPGRSLALAIQVLDPRRLRTPYDLSHDAAIRDGVRLAPSRERLGYYVADPDDGPITSLLSENQFRYIPARRGHRPGIFHGFHRREPEQVRGISVLAPVIKLFRDYTDYMDYEVVGAILAASVPLFIETTPGMDPGAWPGETATETTASGQTLQTKEYAPGQVWYGDKNQKPHVIANNRPGNSFPVFVETLLRSMGAACGLSYETVTKDFSKTNYSSARAALLETWRVIGLYQTWLVNHFCQPVWEMVFEEAWLRGKITLPPGAPDFYQARSAWTASTWTPPKRGHIDPVKEVASGKEAIVSNMMSLSSWYAEQGLDYQEELRQIAKEREFMKELGLTMADLPGFDLAKMATEPE